MVGSNSLGVKLRPGFPGIPYRDRKRPRANLNLSLLVRRVIQRDVQADER